MNQSSWIFTHQYPCLSVSFSKPTHQNLLTLNKYSQFQFRWYCLTWHKILKKIKTWNPKSSRDKSLVSRNIWVEGSINKHLARHFPWWKDLMSKWQSSGFSQPRKPRQFQGNCKRRKHWWVWLRTLPLLMKY